MSLAEPNYTFQPLWNSLCLTAVHCSTRLLALTGVWRGLCLHCRTGAFQDPMGKLCGVVLTQYWEDIGACCLPLYLTVWLHKLSCMTLETSIWTAGQSVPPDTLDLSAVIGTARFHWSDVLMIAAGMAEYDFSTICLWKCHSEINNKWCQAVCMIYSPGFLQETTLTYILGC